MEPAETTNGGLSPSHIRTLKEPVLVPAGVSWYVSGGLAKVSRELVEKECPTCGVTFRVLRRKSPYVNLCQKCRGVVSGGKRGDVHTFSAGSRRRLMRLLATVKKDVRPCLVTLTFPDSYTEYENAEDWKRLLKRFELRFRRRFPAGSFIWRLETVPRKSGEHTGVVKPHFHLLTFGVQYQQLRAFVPTAWFEAVGTGDVKHLQAGTQVSQVRSRRGMFRYASKTVGNLPGELGKDDQTSAEDVGRWWGVAVRKAFQLVVSAVHVVELTEQQAVRVLRAFRRLSHGIGRDLPSLTTFIDGEWFGGNLAKLAEPIAGKNSFLSGRPYGVPFWKWAYETQRLVPSAG